MNIYNSHIHYFVIHFCEAQGKARKPQHVFPVLASISSNIVSFRVIVLYHHVSQLVIECLLVLHGFIHTSLSRRPPSHAVDLNSQIQPEADQIFFLFQ